MKIAILTPCYSHVMPEYAASLARMMHWTATEASITADGQKVNPAIEVFTRSGSLITIARNYLAKQALDWGADYLLWIDADHSFPRHSLIQLLAHDVPIVGVNQPRRATPTGPTAIGLDGQKIWTTAELAQQGKLERIAWTGLAFCLMKASLVRTLSPPLFDIILTGDGFDDCVGEDAYFFQKVYEAGHPVYIDHGLSWEILHAHSIYLSNADTVAQRGEFEQWLTLADQQPQSGRQASRSEHNQHRKI